MKAPTISISPYIRIVEAGCDIAIKNHSRNFEVLLHYKNNIIARANCPRGQGMSGLIALQRVHRDSWGKKSTMRQIIVNFADIAESFVEA